MPGTFGKNEHTCELHAILGFVECLDKKSPDENPDACCRIVVPMKITISHDRLMWREQVEVAIFGFGFDGGQKGPELPAGFCFFFVPKI